MTAPAPIAPWELANEFAAVRLSVDRSGNGPRLVIEDLGSGRRLALDPFRLSALTRATEGAFDALMDPGSTLPATDHDPGETP